MVLYFDTETTGLRPGQICQLSYILQDKKGIVAKNFFFSVDSVEYGAFLVHGLSVEKLKELSKGKRFCDFFDEIDLDFANANLIIAHNVNFDTSFMRKEYENLSKTFYMNKDFCSMKKSTPICKLPRKSGVGYKYPKLNELCEFLDITSNEICNFSNEIFDSNCGYHDARFDVSALYLAVNKAMKKNLFLGIKEYL